MSTPGGTVRQRMIDMLESEAMTALDLSQAVRVTEREVIRHLAHIAKSVVRQRRRLEVTPSTCLACGFTFTKRTRLTRPGRCPRCRRSRIDHPVFRIVGQGPGDAP